MENYIDFVRLSDEESVQYADKIFAEITDDEKLSDLALRLALYTNGKCLQKHYPKLIEKKIFYPSEIYLRADNDIAEKLITLIKAKEVIDTTQNQLSRKQRKEQQKDFRINHVLLCLAWIGTNNVIDFFITSSIEKPIWTKELYILPREYSQEAGWMMDELNNKIDLINPRVIPLTKNQELIDKDFFMQTFKQHDEVCPFCENKLTTVFEIELNSDHHKTQFTTCLFCGCYEPIYMVIDSIGTSKWFSENTMWKRFSENIKIEPIQENILQPSIEKRKPEFTINQFVEISRSQIGGFPTWVGDAEFLDCPVCENRMDYIGQIDQEDLGEEGIYYFHHCDKCKMTGSNYQQT